jgi:hypothetical protein
MSRTRILKINGVIFYDGGVISVSDPSIVTNSITDITSSSVKVNITVEDGGQPVTERGVCWSISSNPTILDNKTNDGDGQGTFNSLITGLDYSTTYYIRGYATNIVGTNYGNEIMFETSEYFKLIFGIDDDIVTWQTDLDLVIWN